MHFVRVQKSNNNFWKLRGKLFPTFYYILSVFTRKNKKRNFFLRQTLGKKKPSNKKKKEISLFYFSGLGGNDWSFSFFISSPILSFTAKKGK